MRGRPPRSPDPELACKLADLEGRLGISRRQLAMRLGIKTNTFYRSVEAGRFSASCRRAIEKGLADMPADTGPQAGTWSTEAREQVLHLLHKIERLVNVDVPLSERHGASDIAAADSSFRPGE